MRSKSEIISLLTNPGIIAVLRAQKAEQVIPLSEALIAGGVIAIEITMTTPNAIEAIRDARKKVGERAVIGVGTVLTENVCRDAVAPGIADDLVEQEELRVGPLPVDSEDRPDLQVGVRPVDPLDLAEPLSLGDELP